MSRPDVDEFIHLSIRQVVFEGGGVFVSPSLKSQELSLEIRNFDAINERNLWHRPLFAVYDKDEKRMARYKGTGLSFSQSIEKSLSKLTYGNFDEIFDEVDLTKFYVLEPGKTYLIWYTICCGGAPSSNIVEFIYSLPLIELSESNWFDSSVVEGVVKGWSKSKEN
ncbi:MAG: hypothetical protein JJU29_22860 [Verrucomicrobia bacterium]|nr:hypothetical protein [Verrucomicrobiota bacterium]MCH8514356.1 hypothetical protein [Kiritimatiellia bacterium]